jgi:hypothetical protein
MSTPNGDTGPPVFRLAGIAALLLLGVLAGETAADGVADDAEALPGVAHATIRRTHALLLIDPAPEPLVPELFDFYLVLSERAATGEISPGWAAYFYVNYYRDLVRDRPTGQPRRSREEIATELQRQVDFFYVRKRPDAVPSPFGAWVWQALPIR